MKMKYVILVLLFTLVNLKENGLRALQTSENVISGNCKKKDNNVCGGIGPMPDYVDYSDYPESCPYYCNDSMFCKVSAENGFTTLTIWCCKDFGGCPE